MKAIITAEYIDMCDGDYDYDDDDDDDDYDDDHHQRFVKLSLTVAI